MYVHNNLLIYGVEENMICDELSFESYTFFRKKKKQLRYRDVIMSAMASQITSLTIIHSTVYSGADKKTSKLRVTGHCEGNSPVTGEFPARRVSNAENVSIWWRHHDSLAHRRHLNKV